MGDTVDIRTPLTEHTRSIRRVMLVVSLSLIAMTWGGLQPNKIEQLGITFEPQEVTALIYLVIAAHVYLTFTFAVACQAETRVWEVQFLASRDGAFEAINSLSLGFDGDAPGRLKSLSAVIAKSGPHVRRRTRRALSALSERLFWIGQYRHHGQRPSGPFPQPEEVFTEVAPPDRRELMLDIAHAIAALRHSAREALESRLYPKAHLRWNQKVRALLRVCRYWYLRGPLYDFLRHTSFLATNLPSEPTEALQVLLHRALTIRPVLTRPTGWLNLPDGFPIVFDLVARTRTVLAQTGGRLTPEERESLRSYTERLLLMEPHFFGDHEFLHRQSRIRDQIERDITNSYRRFVWHSRVETLLPLALSVGALILVASYLVY